MAQPNARAVALKRDGILARLEEARVLAWPRKACIFSDDMLKVEPSIRHQSDTGIIVGLPDSDAVLTLKDRRIFRRLVIEDDDGEAVASEI